MYCSNTMLSSQILWDEHIFFLREVQVSLMYCMYIMNIVYMHLSNASQFTAHVLGVKQKTSSFEVADIFNIYMIYIFFILWYTVTPISKDAREVKHTTRTANTFYSEVGMLKG